MGAICQYLINCNVINQGGKGWSCCGGAHCQLSGAIAHFASRKLKGNGAINKLWVVSGGSHCHCAVDSWMFSFSNILPFVLVPGPQHIGAGGLFSMPVGLCLICYYDFLPISGLTWLIFFPLKISTFKLATSGSVEYEQG